MLRTRPVSNLSAVGARSMMVAGSFRCLCTCSYISASAPPKTPPDQLRNTRAHFLATRRLRPRTVEAGTSTRTAPTLCSCHGRVATSPFSLRSSLLRSRQRLSLSLSACRSGCCKSYSLVQLIHANKELLHACLDAIFSALSALTAACQCRLHDQSTQHQSLYRGSGTIGVFFTPQG